MSLRLALLLVLTLAVAATPSASQAQEQPVDLELILAVDVSGSVDGFEARQQRQGYIDAITDARVIEAIAGGIHGKIALTYVEWADPGFHRVIVPWQVIDSADAAADFAVALDSAAYFPALYTALGDALLFCAGLFDDNGIAGLRRVIDVSGDGPANVGVRVEEARDAVTARGITINGLPILNDRPQPIPMPTPEEFGLEEYYRERVIGGPSAFLVAAQGFDAFRDAILQKLILEIAGRMPEPEPASRAAYRPEP